jgi:uncharacterized membrane protein
MTNKRVLEITTISIFTALIIILATVPMLGFIQIGPVALTIIHIPVLIGGIFGGRKVSISLGLVFGLSSLAIAFIRPSSPIDILFQNPLISVLPRILFGWALYEIYLAFKKFIKNPYYATMSSMVVSTIVHTVLVLTPLFIIGGGATYFGDALLPFIWTVLLTNGFFEAIAAGLIGGPIAERLSVVRDKM